MPGAFGWMGSSRSDSDRGSSGFRSAVLNDSRHIQELPFVVVLIQPQLEHAVGDELLLAVRVNGQDRHVVDPTGAHDELPHAIVGNAAVAKHTGEPLVAVG